MANYDTLTIKIVANTQVALNNIEKLESHLSKLEKQAQDMDLYKMSLVKDLLQDIANIDFSKVAAGLYNITKSFEAFNNKTFMSNFSMAQEESETFTESVEKALEPMEQLDQATLSASASVKELAQEETQLDKFAKKLGEIGLNSSQLENVLRRLGQEKSYLSKDQILLVEQSMKELGYSAEETELAVRDLKKELNRMSKEGQSGLSKLATKFKSLLIYRLMRLILMEIQKAISQGIQDLAKESPQFNEAMSKIKSSFTYIANSLVSAIAPVLIAIAPIIEQIAQVIGDILNDVGELFAIGTGAEQFDKAKYSVDDYAESLKKAKSVSLGIDELNVIQKDEETDRFDSKELEQVSSIKKAWESIGQALQPVKELIHKVFDTAKKIYTLWMNTIGDALEPIYEIIGEIINLTMEGVELFTPIIELTVMVFKPIIAIIGEMIKTIVNLLKDVMPILQPITRIIEYLVVPATAVMACLITILEATKAVFLTFVKLFTFDWFSIGSMWEEAGNNIANAWQKVDETANKMAPVFATGGFPQEDGFFYANHTELIGQFSNGQTVVANNEQIVEGIKQGVYEAMVMAGNGDEKGGTQVVVYLDSNEIAKRVEQRNLARKDNNIVGGYKYGS